MATAYCFPRSLSTVVTLFSLTALHGVTAFITSSRTISVAREGAINVSTELTAVSEKSIELASNLVISATDVTEHVTRQGLINWENPAEAFGGLILLLYIGGSILAGVKYVIVDGWRPKF